MGEISQNFVAFAEYVNFTYATFSALGSISSRHKTFWVGFAVGGDFSAIYPHNGEKSILKELLYLCKDILRYGQKTGQIWPHFWNKKNRSSKEEFNHFLSIFNSASFITQYILCKNFFLQSSNVFFKVNGTDVEQLYNIFFYLSNLFHQND